MLTTLIVLTCLFFLGALQDWMCAVYLRMAADGRHFAASIISIVHTLIGFGVLAALIDELLKGGMAHLLIYSIGGGLGTYIGLRKQNVKRIPTCEKCN